MARFVSPTPILPRPTSPNIRSLYDYDNDLNRALFTYLSDLASRANEAVQSDGSVEMTERLVINVPSDDDTGLQIISTDAGSTVGPYLDIYRNSASPADSDTIGGVSFSGENSAGDQVTYAAVVGQIADTTDTTEDGRLYFQTMNAGTVTNMARVSADGIEVLAGGLKFPTTTLASSDVNTIDFYEEGEWTPTFGLATPGTSSFTYDAANTYGNFFKIGTNVFIHGRCRITAGSAGTGTGALSIFGLPYPGDGNLSGATVAYRAGFTTIGPDGMYISASQMVMVGHTATSVDSLDHTNVGATMDVIFSGWYRAST